MKKLIIFILIFLVVYSSFAQEYKKIYLGKDAKAYKGLYLKFENGFIGGTLHSFYSTSPIKEFQTPVYKSVGDYDFKTDPAAIANRDFLVVNVKGMTLSSYDDRKYIFELKDTLNDETIFYVYDDQFELNFPFLVKGFNYSVEYVKNDLERHVDDFTNEVTISSPVLKDISIIKIIKKGVPVYYLSLHSYGPTLNYGIKGVMLLFKDGTKWDKPDQKVDVKTTEGKNWEYRAFITLNQADLNIFSNKIIDKYRLYIYDNKAPDGAEKFMYYMKAIREMK